MTDTDTADSTDTSEQSRRSEIVDAVVPSDRTLAIVTAVILIASEPAAAQKTICDTQLSGLLKVVFSLLTGLGIIGAVGVYKYQAFMGILTMNPNQMEQMKQRKQQIKTSVLTLIAIDAVYIIAASQTKALPAFGCVFG